MMDNWIVCNILRICVEDDLQAIPERVVLIILKTICRVNF